MSGHDMAAQFLLALLDGSGFANALRRNGTPCRIRWPGNTKTRHVLIDSHLRGAPATLTFHARDHGPWQERVDAVVLAAFCPAADGRCRWIAIDLDGTDHGSKGLADPGQAARMIAERAANAGLESGMVVVRSRRGRGLHVFLILPGRTSLIDAVIGVAALTASAFRIAASDVSECETPHAFRCANGTISRPGDAGAVELLPRSTAKPPFGWAITLPCAGAYAAHGGGILVDPFDDRPLTLSEVPRCDLRAWSTMIAEAKAARRKRRTSVAKPMARRCTTTAPLRRDPLERIDHRTQLFLDGRAQEGTRSTSAFAASANLMGCGVDPGEAERMILAGAAACGLPEREARSAFASAVRTLDRNGRLQ